MSDFMLLLWDGDTLIQDSAYQKNWSIYCMWWWLLGFYDSTRDKDDTTVGVGHSRRYCNTGYDQSQGRRPSTLKCIGPISKGDIEPNHPSEINPNSDSRSRSDGRSRRFVQYRVDQSQGQRPRSLSLPLYILHVISFIPYIAFNLI